MFKQDSGDKDTAVDTASTKKSGLLIVLALLVVATAGFGWSYYKYRQTQKELVKISSLEGQKEIAKKEIEDLLARVRQHMVLPEGEEPVVATITDKDTLAKEQPFYSQAHNGDRVIAYMTARKAIIYDPVRDLIVNSGPIYVDNAAQKQQIDNNTATTTQ